MKNENNAGYNTDVLRLDRCMVCGEIQKYYVRSTNANPDLTDKDINFIMNNRAGQVEMRYCEECKNPRSFQTVGFDC